MIINNENELEFVKYCQQYLDFKGSMHDLYFTHPDAIRKLWRFFVGRLDRREKYSELYEFYEGLQDFLFKYQ